MERKKLFVIGDAVTPTGFSRVTHSIFGKLNKKKWEIHQLGVNYRGDPHNFDYYIYPAWVGGDAMGLNRIEGFATLNPDMIFILNDAWIVHQYLEKIKQYFKKIPPIVVYFPVDAKNFNSNWFRHFDIVTKTVVYTSFAKQVVKEAVPELETIIIPHGVDRDLFFKANAPKREIKKLVYPNTDEFLDSFIILNANRNQPRKRLDIALKGFALFSQGKPDNVKYYHHAGLIDNGWDIIQTSKRLGIDKRLLLTNLEKDVQKIPDNKLNAIYNATDVGLNTSLGEGFGLTQIEHAITGAPQVVPNNSASAELFHDCGILVPTTMEMDLTGVNTTGSVVSPEDVAMGLEKIYTDKELYDELSKKSLEKFSDPKYDWKEISKIWENLFVEVMDDNNIS